MDGCGIMRLHVSQTLIIQSESCGSEGDSEVSSVSGGDSPAAGTWLGKNLSLSMTDPTQEEILETGCHIHPA